MAAESHFGITPWGAWFAEALESFDEGGRLTRGESYANTGRVERLEREGCSVVARVRGRSKPQYRVRIEFKPLAPAHKERIFAAIESDRMLLARIQAGELPPELLDFLKKEQIDLIPRRWSDMKRSCDCPDWGDPCKHMAAVYLVLAKEIDRCPRLLFELRGVDLDARFSRGGAEAALGDGHSCDLVEPPTALPTGPPSLPPIRNYSGLILALLPPKPSFCSLDFSVVLAEFYHRAARGSGIERSKEVDTEQRFSVASYRVELQLERGSPAPRQVPVIFALRVGKPALALTPLELARTFIDFSDDAGGDGYRFLFHFARLARAILASLAIAPRPWVAKGRLRIDWGPLGSAREVQAAITELARYEPGLLRPQAHADGPSRKTVPGRRVVDLLLCSCVEDWVLEQRFAALNVRASLRPFAELFFTGASMDVSKPGETGLPAAISSWLAVLSLDFNSYRYRLEIAESKDIGDSAQYRIKVGVLPEPRGASGPEPRGASARPVPLNKAGSRFGVEALEAPNALSAYLPELRELAAKPSILIGHDRLADFIGEAAGLLSRIGVEIVLPKALHKVLTPRPAIVAKKRAERALKSYLDLDTVLEYEWKIAIGDRLLSPLEFERLVKEKRGVVFFKDGFVRLSPDEAADILRRTRAQGRPSVLDLLLARFSGDAVFSADAEELVASLFRERAQRIPAALNATLRPYQERGYRWALSNLVAGFGCVIADDMGLGKTVQAIAVALGLEEMGLLSEGALVVAPAALLVNWERELARFAPSLVVRRYHGPGRTLHRGPSVSLTTYQTAVRDAEKLRERPFSLLVVDEAHLMKNAETRQSRAVKSLTALRRLALSGTPVENRLEDLRSLMDFAIPGYLGGPAEFKRAYRVPIELERDAEKAERLKAVTAPFLLRRLKTDRAIVSELPDKIVANEYATLTAGQAALYESVVRKGLGEAAEAEGLERGALILRLLTSLKQVCDHPRVYDKESPAMVSQSGKCQLLVALLEEILGRREKVLVFSQYVEAIELLRTVIETELGEEPLLYHGGMRASSRSDSVDSFQGDAARRVMLVSLKTGGLGLNLTAASRVIHFDLWYNPAVENQATDRAFRIGQTRNVFVHRFITTGTFEEKIDAMISSKRELADMTVATGEKWISRMGNEELRSLFEGTY
jgi:superfamily II DNA or RNA helicase